MSWLNLLVDSKHNWLVYIMMPELQIIALDASLVTVLFGAKFHCFWNGESILEPHDFSRDRLCPFLMRSSLWWRHLFRPLSVHWSWALRDRIMATRSGTIHKAVGSLIKGISGLVLSKVANQGCLISSVLFLGNWTLLVVTHRSLEALFFEFRKHYLIWPNDYALSLILGFIVAKTWGSLVKFVSIEVNSFELSICSSECSSSRVHHRGWCFVWSMTWVGCGVHLLKCVALQHQILRHFYLATIKSNKWL